MNSRDNKNLHAGHRKRMRERFSKDGFSSFQPHEVLEYLLYGCLPRVNTNPHGHRLIEAFGSVRGVLEAKKEDLTRIEGIGQASAAYLTESREEVSGLIREQYRGETNLDAYAFAFLTDWFMRDKDRPVGILIREANGAFLDFLCLPLVRNDEGIVEAEKMFDFSVPDMTNREFSLFLPWDCTLDERDVQAIRRYTFSKSFILDEIYQMKGREAVPTLHPSGSLR